MTQTEETIPRMLTIKECSKQTGVSYDAIRKLCLTGKIIHIRVGSKYLINFGKFVDFLNSSCG